MKISVIALSLLLPAIAFAQEMPSMNQTDIENMMNNLQGVETCMQNIDEKKLDELKRGAERVKSEVDALCRAEKRSQAQAMAVLYGKKMANDPTMQAMMKCVEPMKGMMKSVPMMPFDEVIENSDRHVCD